MVYTLSMFFRVDVDLTKTGAAWIKYYFFGSVSIVLCALVDIIAMLNHTGVMGIPVP